MPANHEMAYRLTYFVSLDVHCIDAMYMGHDSSMCDVVRVIGCPLFVSQDVVNGHTSMQLVLRSGSS